MPRAIDDLRPPEGWRRHRRGHGVLIRVPVYVLLFLFFFSSCLQIGTELADNETLPKAMTDLQQWLKRGECNRKEVTNFYTALHHVHTHAR